MVEIENPQYFAFIGQLKHKDDCGFVFHTATIVQKETSVHFELFINSQDEKFVKGLAAEIWKYRGRLPHCAGSAEADAQLEAELAANNSDQSNNNNNESNDASQASDNNSGFVRAQAAGRFNHNYTVEDQQEEEVSDVHIDIDEDDLFA